MISETVAVVGGRSASYEVKTKSSSRTNGSGTSMRAPGKRSRSE
jgi:hypothetical protein